MEWSDKKTKSESRNGKKINTREYKKCHRKTNKTQNRKSEVSIRKMDNV
jgi:hypothetical protein